VGLHVVAGGLLLVAAYAISRRLELAVHWLQVRHILVALGLILPLLAAFHGRPVVARVSAGICLSVSSLVLAVASAELMFRWLDFDFRRQEEAYRRIPPFFRRPMVPTGTVFFRRDGPEEWTGPVIRTLLRQSGFPTAAYAGEPVITVRYDRYGFRNEPRPAGWEIAVAGDSFTELGHLAYEDLFTTVLGRRVGQQVVNLGVSHTGPLTQLSYLQDYGLSPQTRQTVIVFFEGNDLDDVAGEHGALVRYQSKQVRTYPRFRKQTSLLRALGELRRRSGVAAEQLAPPVDAYFDSAAGRVPLTLANAPPEPGELSAMMQSALEIFFDAYAAFGEEHRLRVWLAYMPCKLRVVYGRVEYAEAAPPAVKAWRSTDLPDFIGAECVRRGIGFVDLTPALVEATERTRQLMFNALYDTHLSARGSAVVGEELARHLGEWRLEP